MDYTSIFTLMRGRSDPHGNPRPRISLRPRRRERGRRRFSAVVCGLLAVQTAVCLLPGGEGEAFGGCFSTIRCTASSRAFSPRGASRRLLTGEHLAAARGYAPQAGRILTSSPSPTLLGMYFMIGAGNFLLFFIGLELASVPAAVWWLSTNTSAIRPRPEPVHPLRAVFERPDALRHLCSSTEPPERSISTT